MPGKVVINMEKNNKSLSDRDRAMMEGLRGEEFDLFAESLQREIGMVLKGGNHRQRYRTSRLREYKNRFNSRRWLLQ